MKVLFITSTRIGDAVLATSVLNYIIKTYPRSSIFLASGNEPVQIYTNYKNIKKIFVIGGRSIYKLFFNDAKFLHITNIQYIDEGINEFFPIPLNQIEKKFHKISSEILCDKAIYTYWKYSTR